VPRRRTRPADPSPTGLPRLRKSREEAAQLLQVQIAAGAELKDGIDIGAYLPGAADAHQGNATRWNAHNNTLLRAVFDTDEVAVDYGNSTLGRIGTTYDDDRKRLMNLRATVTKGISFLQGLVETLYLYEPIADGLSIVPVPVEMSVGVPNLEKKLAQRTQFLRVLYEVTGGDTKAGIAPQTVGDHLELSATQTGSVRDYLVGAGFVHWIAFDRIEITFDGVVEVERLQTPKHQTEHGTPPATQNYLNFHGPVYGAQIQQGTTDSSQVLSIASPGEVEAVRKWATKVRAAEAALQLPEDAFRNLDSELAKLETQIHSDTPKRSLLHASVATVGSILKLAAAETAAIELVKGLPQLLQLLSHLG